LASKAVPPVLTRLWCFCCSLSDGERDLLRVDSASGMVVIQFKNLYQLLCGFKAQMDWIGFGERIPIWGGSDGHVGCM